MNYRQVIKYLNSLERFGIQLGLERITRLLELLGNPHQDLRCIHVAGTNGKGSTTTFIGEILKKAGFKVGVYTSPHFVSFTERITINGLPIPEAEVAKIISERILPVIKILPSHPTYFEIATAVAFLYFAQEKVDFAVLEVGLGGRLDATNVIIPLVSVITSIGLEHQDVLGETIEEIAFEKAGIIKQGVSVVTSASQPEVLKVIKKMAKHQGAKLYQVGQDIKFVIKQFPANPNSNYQFSVKGILKEYNGLRTSLLGYHQIINATTAICVIEVLQKYHEVKITTQAIKKGLLQARIRGRLELTKKSPFVLLDGAHNPASAAVLRKALEDYFSRMRLILVVGILQDKDVRGIVKELFQGNKNLALVIITQPKINRSLDPKKIYAEISKYTNKIHILPTVAEGIKYAEAIAGYRDLICITGSLYTVAEAIMEERNRGRLVKKTINLHFISS
ncbi:MAG: folylpolyglutamate synthase/dihydrofolate synthase family protein [bacterium]|nr:folylpolyglutamate synthase/dihydrofolate synthase family protein [bacterium]